MLKSLKYRLEEILKTEVDVIYRPLPRRNYFEKSLVGNQNSQGYDWKMYV